MTVGVVDCWQHRLDCCYYLHSQGSSLTQGYKTSPREPSPMTDRYRHRKGHHTDFIGRSLRHSSELHMLAAGESVLTASVKLLLTHFVSPNSSFLVRWHWANRTTCKSLAQNLFPSKPYLRERSKCGPRKRTITCLWNQSTCKPTGSEDRITSWR